MNFLYCILLFGWAQAAIAAAGLRSSDLISAYRSPIGEKILVFRSHEKSGQNLYFWAEKGDNYFEIPVFKNEGASIEFEDPLTHQIGHMSLENGTLAVTFDSARREYESVDDSHVEVLRQKLKNKALAIHEVGKFQISNVQRPLLVAVRSTSFPVREMYLAVVEPFYHPPGGTFPGPFDKLKILLRLKQKTREWKTLAVAAASLTSDGVDFIARGGEITRVHFDNSGLGWVRYHEEKIPIAPMTDNEYRKIRSEVLNQVNGNWKINWPIPNPSTLPSEEQACDGELAGADLP